MSLGILASETLDDLASNLRERYPTVQTDDINRYGFRDHDIILDCDTCYYGCSVTYGYGVSLSQRYTNLLNRVSNNFGVCGIGIDEMLLVFMATSKFVNMKQAVFMFPSDLRYTVPLDGRYYNIFPNYQKSNPGHKLIEEFGKTFYQLPESYFEDKFKNHIAMLIYIAGMKNIKLYFSSWVPRVYDRLGELVKAHSNVTLVDAMHNDMQAADSRHPGKEAHKQIAGKFNELFRN